VRHVLDLHSKFALRPHHVWKHGRQKEEEDEEEEEDETTG